MHVVMLRPVVSLCLIVVMCSFISFVISDKDSRYAHGSGYDTVIRDRTGMDTGIQDKDTVSMSGYVSNMYVTEISYGEGVSERFLEVCIRDVRVYEPLDKNGCSIGMPWQQVRVSLPEDSSVHMGEYIMVRGKVRMFERATNPGQFDSYEYYYDRGILCALTSSVLTASDRKWSVMRQALYDMRMTGESILGRYLKQDDAAIIKAMLFGNKNEIDGDTRELFRKNGIAHILAISGLHISFFAMLFYKLLGVFTVPIWARALMSEAAIVLYGTMVGYTPSSFRAIFMFSVFLLSVTCKRTYDMLTALSMSLMIIALCRPAMLFDTGLKLSFMAVIGVGFFAAMYGRNISAKRVPSVLSVSAFVFLATLPVLLSAYYEAAFYSILLNLLIIPLMSVLLTSSVILVLLGAMFRPIPVIRIIELILDIYKGLCRILSGIESLRSNIGAPSICQIVLFYAILMLSVMYRGRYRRLLSVVSIFVAVVILYIHPTRGLDVWMLDVGQGDCMVLRASDSFLTSSHTYIIDCGSSSKRSVGENRLIPMLKYYGVDRVDAVFITHPDADHINGLGQLITDAAKENLVIDNIYVFSGFLDDPALKEMTDVSDMTEMSEERRVAQTNSSMLTRWVNRACEGLAEKHDHKYEMTGMDKGMKLCDGLLTFNVLYPERGHDIADPNDASLVMDISYGAFHMITTGDIGQNAEDSIIREYDDSGIDADFLKVAHHGSGGSSSDGFLDLVKPEISVISCGKDNSYGHPHNETLQRLTEHGTSIYRTDRMGAIMLHTDGKRQYLCTFGHTDHKKEYY